MRIAHFINDLDGQGGIETYVERLGHGLSAAGHEVIYFGRQGATTDEHFHVRDAEDLYLQAQGRCVDVLHLHKAVQNVPPDDLPVIRTVHDNGGSCPSGSRYLSRLGKPCDRTASLATCLFGHYVDGCGSRRPQKVWRNFQRLANNQRLLPAIPTIAVSQYLKDEMIALGYPESGIEVVRSPAPDGPSSPTPLRDDVPIRLLFIGRLVPEKGVDWLLRALSPLPSFVHLDIVGEGHARSTLEAQTEDLGLGDRVTFHGWIQQSSLPPFLEAARAVVVPSVWHEPAGLVPLEAAAYGRPTVVSTVGGLPEYGSLEYALQVPPHDDDALTAALLQLCTDTNLATTLGLAGHKAARTNFQLSSFIHQHERLYAALFPQAHDVLPA